MKYFDLKRKRKKCANIIKKINSLEWESNTQCNLCKSNSIVQISNIDRYGLKIRSGICNNCGLVFLLDRLTKESYNYFYSTGLYRDLVSVFNEKVIDKKSIYEVQRSYAQNLICSFDEYFERNRNGLMLDIGGSSGNISKILGEKYGYELTIIDPAIEELEYNSQKNIELVNELLENYDSGNKKFDIVLLYQTIDHLFDLEGSLNKVKGMLSKNGLFIFDIVDFGVCCNYGPADHFLKIDHCYYLSHEIIAKILKLFGFSVLSSEIYSNPLHVTYVCCKKNSIEISGLKIDNQDFIFPLINKIRKWNQNRYKFNYFEKLRIGLYRIIKKLK